jgi:hypothetical protein
MCIDTVGRLAYVPAQELEVGNSDEHLGGGPMAQASASHPGRGNHPFLPCVRDGKAQRRNWNASRSLALLAVALILSPILLAQVNAQVTAVDPSSGKVNDSVTITGTNLGKGSVAAVFLSDDKDDFKATIVEQGDEKIVMKVPQVKAGSYHVSVQVGDKLLIKPIRFTVEE